MQDRKEILCFRVVGAVAGYNWLTLAQSAVGVTKGKAEKTGVKSELAENGDGELGEPDFGIARDV